MVFDINILLGVLLDPYSSCPTWLVVCLLRDEGSEDARSTAPPRTKFVLGKKKAKPEEQLVRNEKTEVNGFYGICS
jgi:hypothetical protein